MAQSTKLPWAERIENAKRDPWLWLRDLVNTWDNHDPTTIFKPWPHKAMYRVIARVWNETDVLFIEKSRQIMMTWIMAALFLWDALTKYSRLILLQSKKQDDANDILERARHIYVSCHDLQLPWLPKIKMTGGNFGTSDSLIFPEIKSELRAIPQGADVVRMHTCSGIFADEMNHQPEFEEGFGAAKPTITGGGKYVAGGTANGHTFGWMKLQGIDSLTLEKLGPHKIDSSRLANERLIAPEGLDTESKRRWIEQQLIDMPDEEFNSLPLDQLVSMVPGMRYWVTADGASCLRVHYSADPEKSPETEAGRNWIEEARQAMTPAQWDREMEIKYDVFDARPVIQGFTRELYVERLEFKPGATLYLSIDFGQKCGCIFYQVYNIKGHNVKRVRILDEIFLENADTLALRDAILDKLNGRFYHAWKNNEVRAYSDPAGNQGRETTSDKAYNTSNKILAASGIRCTSKRIGVVDGTAFVQSMFLRILPDGKPAVLVDPRCEFLFSCYAGGWHFPKIQKGMTTQQNNRPEKDNYYEHGGDMTVYGFCNVLTEYDVTDKDRTTMQKAPFKRRRHTGEIIGRRRVGRVNRRRGEHAVR